MVNASSWVMSAPMTQHVPRGRCVRQVSVSTKGCLVLDRWTVQPTKPVSMGCAVVRGVRPIVIVGLRLVASMGLVYRQTPNVWPMETVPRASLANQVFVPLPAVARAMPSVQETRFVLMDGVKRTTLVARMMRNVVPTLIV